MEYLDTGGAWSTPSDMQTTVMITLVNQISTNNPRDIWKHFGHDWIHVLEHVNEYDMVSDALWIGCESDIGSPESGKFTEEFTGKFTGISGTTVCVFTSASCTDGSAMYCFSGGAIRCKHLFIDCVIFSCNTVWPLNCSIKSLTRLNPLWREMVEMISIFSCFLT